MFETPLKPRRRFLQFSLRTLFVVAMRGAVAILLIVHMIRNPPEEIEFSTGPRIQPGFSYSELRPAPRPGQPPEDSPATQVDRP
jgi:hypothetical protein